MAIGYAMGERISINPDTISTKKDAIASLCGPVNTALGRISPNISTKTEAAGNQRERRDGVGERWKDGKGQNRLSSQPVGHQLHIASLLTDADDNRAPRGHQFIEKERQSFVRVECIA